jgi:hypothetical protein
MRAHEFIVEFVSPEELEKVEKFADNQWKKAGVDVDFSRHFGDRVNDERNGKPISAAELVRIFKKEYERNAKPIAQMSDPEAVMVDKGTDINIPFALNPMYNKKNMVAKTVMRKPNFHTPDKEFVVNDRNSQ